MINWKVTKKDAKLIRKIAERAIKTIPGGPRDIQSLEMDLTAVHLNGCKLDLSKLLSFGEFDFFHDIFGIMRFIDRNDGHLMDAFLPRCFAKEEKGRSEIMLEKPCAERDWSVVLRKFGPTEWVTHFYNAANDDFQCGHYFQNPRNAVLDFESRV